MMISSFSPASSSSLEEVLQWAVLLKGLMEHAAGNIGLSSDRSTGFFRSSNPFVKELVASSLFKQEAIRRYNNFAQTSAMTFCLTDNKDVLVVTKNKCLLLTLQQSCTRK